MRITQQSIVNNFVQDLNSNRIELARLNQQIATQKRVNKPSDDPGAYSESRILDARVTRNEQFQNSIQAGIEQAQSAEDTINYMLDQLNDAKKLAVQGANSDALDQDALDIIAENVAGIRSALIQLGNKRYNDRFLFAGTATQTTPFSESGGAVSYNGNDEQIVVPISDNLTTAISVTGDDLFDIGGANDVFATLDRLETALRNGNNSAIRAELDFIDRAVTGVSSAAGQLGNSILRMEFAYEEYVTSNNNLRANISRNVDTDMAEAISRYQTLETSYAAALSAGSRLLQLSLVNFL